jgi:DNA-binding transcriptional ArsR family regulator
VRPLFHPAVSDITVEGLLYALSDPVRAQIYAEMATSECPLNCSNFRKVDNRTLPKATLSQHFKILREAGLIRSERKASKCTTRPVVRNSKNVSATCSPRSSLLTLPKIRAGEAEVHEFTS